MNSILCLLAVAAALFVGIFIAIWRLTMPPQEQARYYVRHRGWTQRRTADHLGMSRYALRRALAT